MLSKSRETLRRQRRIAPEQQYAKLAGVPVNQTGPNVITSSSIEGVGTPKRELLQEAVNDGYAPMMSRGTRDRGQCASRSVYLYTLATPAFPFQTQQCLDRKVLYADSDIRRCRRACISKSSHDITFPGVNLCTNSLRLERCSGLVLVRR